MGRKNWIVGFLVVVGVSAALAIALRAREQRYPRVERLAQEGYMGEPGHWVDHGALLGHRARRLELSDWRGTPVTPEAMHGKIVLIDFWATWCDPCLEAVPHMNEVARKYADKGVLVFGACGGEESERMKAVADGAKMEYPTGRASEQTAKAWGVQFYPQYTILDRTGNIRAIGIKAEYVERILDELLKE